MAVGPFRAFTPSVQISESLSLAVAREATNIIGGAGLMRRLVPPSGNYGPFVPLPGLVAIRDDVYRQYELSTFSYLTLAAVEQALRALAEHSGVAHIKSNGAPRGVMNWAAQLPLTSSSKDAVASLYSDAAGGVRNRVAHGSLIDIDCKRYERQLFVSGQAGRLSAAPDSFLPENIATLCIEALMSIDRDVGAAGITTTDFRWMVRLAPSADDCAFAASLCTGLDGDDPQGWLQQISGFLAVFCPAVGRTYMTGALHWIDHGLPTTHIELTYLVLALEAVYRVVAQVLGFPCLNALVVGTELRAQYLMLDEAGLNAVSFIDDTVSAVPTQLGQVNARRCLQIATTTRNACVHGALGAAASSSLEALSKAIILTVDLLVARALHHMTQEAAYFVWLRAARKGHEIDPTRAWRQGEAEMLAELAREARARREIPGSAYAP